MLQLNATAHTLFCWSQELKSVHSIQVQVASKFLPEASNAAEHQYLFAYTVTITNHGHEAVQLLDRYWLIHDADQEPIEVQGPGVVGEQPHIEPAARYKYTSGARLNSPLGTMEGHYAMITASGVLLSVPIERFSLVATGMVH